ncbi:hypothetical protein [Microbacterium sp. SL75]|uniref:hypothetical protein n=1 Tax=Microbacterium sp. SL75 TaxID=2995140 RepID=UPI002270E0C1|nr:hypothetical protein [Microbacterium sp. SL75]WAC68891.1 hypothetical protein OVA17_15085 [Microbacterium sp. SL75]
MKAFLTRLAGWFTDARRQALQALVASATSLLVILGAVTDVQSSALLDLSASGLLAVQGALGLILLRPGDRFTWLNTTGRGVIYSLGGAIGVVGFTFSLWSESTSSLILQVATVIASILIGAVQMVNAGTLSAPMVLDPVDAGRARLASAVAARVAAESADAARPVEASPATFAKERKPGLRVGVFWPFLPRVDRDRVSDAAGAAFPDAETTYLLTSATEFRGLSLDVVLVTVPLTRALVEVFEPNVAASSFDGQRVQYLEVV